MGDAGTNLCNMENLYCNSDTKNYGNGVGCKSLTGDLSYDTTYQECGRYRNNNSYREHDCQDFVDPLKVTKTEPLKLRLSSLRSTQVRRFTWITLSYLPKKPRRSSKVVLVFSKPLQ